MQLTVRDAAKELNVAEKTVYRWIQSGGLPAYRVAGQYRINRAMLYDWASSKSMNFSSEAPAEAESHALPLLSAALQNGGVHYNVPGATKAEVLKAAVDCLSIPEHVNREFLVQALLTREQLQSTGIGDGVAIPHVRNPAVLELIVPQVCLCFLAAPVAFDALDGKPVHALFLPLSPNVRCHLHLLSKIAFALRDGRVKDLMAKAADSEALLTAFRALETASADA